MIFKGKTKRKKLPKINFKMKFNLFDRKVPRADKKAHFNLNGEGVPFK